ncbi:unnamed protein product [Echinostoma caproni]|uniref:Protein FAM98B n=1 Tax=Echinostoma caproni TaxID=27848 RepID=A0A183AQU3_9TREM|nr:unnamed protein product [Echinostoma caproni]
MAPKYKNDLAKCYGLLKLDLNWKQTTEDVIHFSNALSVTTTQLAADHEEIHPIQKIDGIPISMSSYHLFLSLDAAKEQKLYDEVTQFLDKYGCPYPVLMNKAVPDRFTVSDNRMLLLRYFCTEILAQRKLASRPQSVRTDARISQAADEASAEISSDLTACLEVACNALGLSKPPNNVSVSELFTRLINTSTEAIKRCPPMHMGQPMIPLVGLSDRQWSQIARIAALLQQEYASRRATLLKRLDVTVQSFKWSDKAKTQLEAIAAVYNPLRTAMSISYFPGIPELLAVRDNMILRIEKTSGVTARQFTSCELNKVLIGKVPDRGGRAWELEPPPPEMPSFKQRQPERGRGGGYAGGGGGHGGGGGGGYAGGGGGYGGGGGRPDTGRGGGGGGSGRGGGGPGRGRGYGDYPGPNRGGGGGGGFGGGGGAGGGSYGGAYYTGGQQFRPPAPSAHLGGGDYITSQVAMDGLAQQFYGLTFEPGLGIGQAQGYAFQATNMPGNINYGGGGGYGGGGTYPAQRGRGGRGGRGRGR